MYDIDKIEQLAGVYAETADDRGYELLLELLIPVIDIQLSQKYSNLREYWDDMRQEVLLKLWKNRTTLCFTKSKKLYRFLRERIRDNLNRSMNKIKKDYVTE